MTFTINLCNVGASFGAADVFSIDMANPYAEELASVSFGIDDLDFDGQVTETDFSGFSIYADNRSGVFGPGPLIDIPGGPSSVPFPEVTMLTTPRAAPVGMNCFCYWIEEP